MAMSDEMYVSSGQRRLGGGLENYTFEVPLKLITGVAQRNPGRDDILKQALAAQYLLSPRPDAREILSVKVLPTSPNARVELVIQRGHYQLARLVREHEEVTFNLSAGIARCTCHPGAIYPLVENSIPDYGVSL
jgi:hypothetical protein